MKPSVAVDLVAELLPAWNTNRSSLDRVDKWFRGENEKPWMPTQSTQEYKDLQARAVNRFLKMVVTSFTEVLYVDGYRRKADPENAAAWQVWQANSLDARQLAVHEGAMAHALSYVSIVPGVDFRGEPMPKIRGHSSRTMMAWYQDESEDEWPMYALSGRSGKVAGRPVWHLKLYDAEAIYRLSVEASAPTATPPKFIDYQSHDAGACPVVRFANTLDLDGRAEGEVEPNIPLAARIDQDIFDRLVVQRFGAFKVRWATGMEEPETDDEKRAAKLRVMIGEVLVNESPDAKFGVLEETQIDGYVKAYETDTREMATITKVPPHQLLGQMANLSAEALAAAESSFSRKVEARKMMFGEAWEQVLRMASWLTGDTDGATAFDAEVRWRDMESRSLAQTADALGKLAQMLGVPPQALWERIPGVTQQDLEAWKTLAEEADPFGALAAQLTGGIEPQPVE